MPTRTLTAQQAGPILIDAQLLGAGGVVTVRTDRTRKEAEITIRTADETGDSADAVRDADLRWDARGALIAHVQGKGGGISGGTTTIIRGGGGTSVVQSFGTVHGSVTGMVIDGDMTMVGGNVYVNGRRITPGQGSTTIITGSSPIEITAVVPEGSSVTARTQSADVIADGTYAAVSASTQSGTVRAPGKTERFTAGTQSGNVDVENSPNIIAKTQSGDIRLGRTDVVEASTMSGDVTIRDFGGTAQLGSMSGDIRVHATAGGDITAKTMSGDVNVTATEQAVNDDLDVRANSMSGDVRLPQRRQRSTGGGPRRRS
ncbi:DUF4097 family beta strand repeat-containing protein [Streptomyces scabiei]|uniref:DUF4097 family beta strand repeat-containing protein n=1 Tax=Streptomyces scabiei TaxID=1930 RepID=UPI0029B303F9|nr:DUF4097 family beta strand repeat-containing protein [Streptomyces scabiei]MDX2630298.1 DUF4097 family beta strand repeat-containing protein [Streptomyces scabiei]MDX2630305.1 DUF4097 family beta strand repeat-containing protein [Streptomyces scabiei]